ncbi:Cytoplasmic tRNA 2-thiolation protein 2 [Golovinomyces cichoracearum]|uniref:Cytoplasmic tRNA 2-thiolation protein 2 n=1 Tax=Golovinomyces cichoracearum TaxID=62708 RepID=A0A420J1D9_9PEZI|nr:Cytoplasmic tRNA 2-thiolation protein 2 [Golovinomyces cichoracearum]
MQTYRIRGSRLSPPRRLLLPLSYGPSSSSLLYILDSHLQGQYNKTHKVTYELVVVHIDFFVTSADRDFSSGKLEQYRSLFSRHLFISHGLEESLDLEGIDWDALGVPRLSQNGNSTERLQNFLSSAKSTTDRADIISILMTRLLVSIGKKNACDGILFGDSTTRLAEKTLTETAKGRGITVPWQVCDGATPYDIDFNYPQRDVLKKEILNFSRITSVLHELVVYDQTVHISASSKSITINDLMAQYFQSIETNFPSIVSNVVKTSSKLNVVVDNSTNYCGVCGVPCYGNKITSPESDETSDTSLSIEKLNIAKIICYGCSKIVGSKNLNFFPS